MDRALYGPEGFYTTGEGASGHFRTSASGSPGLHAIFAGAVAELLERVDATLGRPARLDLVDVGAGSSDLLESVLGTLGADVRARVRPTVVERRAAPESLAAGINWLGAVPEMTGLLIANEWLDNVPLDIVVGDRLLLVDEAGVESAGPAPSQAEAAWLTSWWPIGARREIGVRRDIAWGEAVAQLSRGMAVAIDYAHLAEQRPPYGTLTGFRLGRDVEPIPDGDCDLTAHLAIDSVALAGEAAARGKGRSVRTLLTDQRSALRSIGVDGRRPAYASDPTGYAKALQRATEAAELVEPAGLGGFAWLVQGIDLDPAAVLPLLSAPPQP